MDSLASCAALYVHNAQRILLALDQGSCKTLADLPWTKASTKKARHCTHVLSNMGATKGVSLEHGLHPITIKNCFKKKTLFFFCTDFSYQSGFFGQVRIFCCGTDELSSVRIFWIVSFENFILVTK